ncbi:MULTISPECIES: hypothetical protein [unclassified Chryseobacterium]|uniref:hypothetical protein n=1 Tax=unclassified Chryseobacterium TaxID=2593645 RepID=UPI000F4D2F11|nr:MULTISPECIES: hypothetical protein [unclassified Chryseobacterium]
MTISEQLKHEQVRHTIIDGEEYFYVDDIKDKFGYLILDITKVIYKDETPLIKPEFIQKLSKFDQFMKQTLIFKPKKKDKED